MKLTLFYPDGLKDVYEMVDEEEVEVALATGTFRLDRSGHFAYIPFTAIRKFETEEEDEGDTT